MNFGKDMNFSQLRKIFPSIFVGALGFWISIGIIFIVLIIFLFVFIYPLSYQYIKRYRDLEDLSTALERYALKKDLYNDKWIESKKLEIDLYEKEVGKCKSFLRSRDDRLEAVFVMEDPEKGLIKIEDQALWKNEYLKRISTLLTKIQTNNISLSEGALPFQNWGSVIPTWDAILPVQKRFWIIEALINAVTGNTGIIKLKKINFLESSYSHDPSFVQIYTVIPITLDVELQANRIKFLLHEILKSDIPFVIEGITILSTGTIFNPDTSLENEAILIQDTKNYLFNPIIDVAIDAYVIDCKT